MAGNPQAYFPGIEAAIFNMLTLATGPNGIFFQQDSVAINASATAASETAIIDLSTSSTLYQLNNLVIKSADPGTYAVNVKLYELVNDVLTETKLYPIQTNAYQTYFDLPTLYGLQQVSGSQLKVTIQATGGGPFAVTGQYQYAKTNVF